MLRSISIPRLHISLYSSLRSPYKQTLQAPVNNTARLNFNKLFKLFARRYVPEIVIQRDKEEAENETSILAFRSRRELLTFPVTKMRFAAEYRVIRAGNSIERGPGTSCLRTPRSRALEMRPRALKGIAVNFF